jgi:hypothetical protein
MEPYKLSPRKPDLLDELDALRKRRGIAYRAGDFALEQVHQEMKAFWLRNGWSEDEAQAEYEIHAKECEVPYNSTVDELSNIKGKLLLMAHS